MATQKKYVSLSKLSSFLDNLKTLFATKTELNSKANASHTHTIANVTNLQTTLDSKVPSTRTINGKALSANITLSASDVGADASGAASAVQTNLDAVSDTLTEHTDNADIHFTATERTKLSGIAAGAQVNTVTGVKGNSETSYRTGNINITKANIGLGNVDNTADSAKSVKYATSAGSATSSTKATQDADGNVIVDTYETKSDASAKLTEAKDYTDTEVAKKANTSHTHAIADVTNLQTTIDTINDEIDGSVKSLSVSGRTITYTKNDGTTGVITTQDTNTDTKVTQTVTTTDAEYPLLASATANRTATATEASRFASGVTLNPADKSITATTFIGNLSGNATTATSATSATSATKATQDGSGNVITSTYETKSAASSKLAEAKTYTDTSISKLINGAPTTLDTLGEIATAMEENADVVQALNDAVGTKANASDLTSHTSDTSNPHGVTKAQIGLGNVENKSSATIRGELTKANVTSALGYTPPTTNTTYGVATSSALGLVKSGTDITVDSSGNVSVKDDSHNHVIANIDNLQATLDSKMSSTIVSLEMNNKGGLKGYGGFIDFHYHDSDGNPTDTSGTVATSTPNYTSRIIESSAGTISINGVNVTGSTVTGSLSGNASSATKLATARTISLTGDVTGSGSFDGSGNLSITATVADDSHNHTIANVDGLQTALNGKASSSHTHTTTIATSTGTNELTLAHGTKYAITAGGDSFVFTMPNDNNTDTKVTSVGNHYTPSADSSAALSADASSTTAATWNSTSLVTGVNLQRDAKGHVTGVTVDSIKMPANPNSDTKVTNTLATTTKAYVTGTTSSSTNTGTQVFDTGVYLDTTAGQLTATTFNGTTFSGSGVATVSEVEAYLGIS